MLYAGTDEPLPERSLDGSNTNLCVKALTQSEAVIKAHFTKAAVQYIGSTAGCGCDFPFALFHKGEWFPDEDSDPDWEAKTKLNREMLVALLASSGECVVELYGVWAGDFDKQPRVTESISLEAIVQADFFFKEQGFYRVACKK